MVSHRCSACTHVNIAHALYNMLEKKSAVVLKNVISCSRKRYTTARSKLDECSRGVLWRKKFRISTITLLRCNDMNDPMGHSSSRAVREYELFGQMEAITAGNDG